MQTFCTWPLPIGQQNSAKRNQGCQVIPLCSDLDWDTFGACEHHMPCTLMLAPQFQHVSGMLSFA
jgi:hypothetical protein